MDLKIIFFFEVQEPTFIIDNLWLGSYQAAINRHFLIQNNVTHILYLLKEEKPVYPKIFKYKQIKIEDNEKENLFQYFDEAIEYIEKVRLNNEGVLVHCAAGVSRSPSIVIAYLMASEKIPFEQAFEFVKQKRPGVSPNDSFRDQLKLFESTLEMTYDEKKKKNCIIN